MQNPHRLNHRCRSFRIPTQGRTSDLGGLMILVRQLTTHRFPIGPPVQLTGHRSPIRLLVQARPGQANTHSSGPLAAERAPPAATSLDDDDLIRLTEVLVSCGLVLTDQAPT
eukprot:338873-Rhodomonas_salina.1